MSQLVRTYVNYLYRCQSLQILKQKMSFFPLQKSQNGSKTQENGNNFNGQKNSIKFNTQNINELLKITDQPTFKNALSFNNYQKQSQLIPKVQQYRFASLEQQKQKQPDRNSYLSPQPSNNYNKMYKQTSANHQRRLPQSNASKKVSQNEMLSKLIKKIDKLQKQNVKLREENEMLKKRIVSLQEKIYNNQAEKNNQIKIVMNENINNSQNQAQIRSLASNQRKKIKSPFVKHSTQKVNSLYMSGSPYKTKFSQSSTSTNLLKQLLLQCNQSKQFQSTKRTLQLKRSQFQKDEFYQYKNTRDCFEPFYQNIKKQLQLRLRKCIIREKDLLYKDDYVQIGTLSSILDQHSFKIEVVLTNLLNQSLKEVNIVYLSNTDTSIQKAIKVGANIEVIKSTKNQTIYEELKSGQQLKQTLNIVANNVDFRCILINVEFMDHKKQIKSISQILPASKHKLFVQKIFTPIPQSFSLIQKVVFSDKKLLPEINKLKQYYKSIHCTKNKIGNDWYELKVQFLKKIFYVEMDNVGEQKIRIGVHHDIVDSLIADKVLNQFVFIFEK